MYLLVQVLGYERTRVAEPWASGPPGVSRPTTRLFPHDQTRIHAAGPLHGINRLM